MYTAFEIDLFNKMNNISISGTEPSSVILNQRRLFQKLERAKQAKAKRNGVINPHNYNFNQFYTENFDALKRYESTEVDRRNWQHGPLGTHWSTSSDTHQVLEK